ncbi:MAG: hypothetical protein MJ052_03730 [Sphaerochaetaceae bacterium]|nr:hypothetical protein [Sphaerochaetaceae bacterium]
MEKRDNKSAKAYIYLVKTPSSNEMTVCASESVFYPGTYVIAPTRYGLDMGIVVGSANDIESSYQAGCPCVRGACHFGPVKPVEDAPAACGEPETLGDLPTFEMKEVKGIPSEKQTADDESSCWDKMYKAPGMSIVDGDVMWIKGRATPDDIRRFKENKDKEKEAISLCREKISRHGLEMKLVAAHFLLCEPKVLFFFTADDRVDFRELVKDLVSVFRMRIELRQIGVRDESRVLGGLAICGRDFCCHAVSDKLDPVTIKMAKEQNLSLNSMKISGPCGRLLCCLSYEYDFYCEEKRAYPAEGTRLKIGDELFRVEEVNILSKKVTATGSEGNTVSVPREQIFWSDRNNRWEVSREFQQDFIDG